MRFPVPLREDRAYDLLTLVGDHGSLLEPWVVDDRGKQVNYQMGWLPS